MAYVSYVSPGVYDAMLGSATITATTVNVTTAGITSAGTTAPNLVNAITGCWIWVATVPSVANSGNFTVEIMESGVSKALATINYADIKTNAMYVRFATPYTFATLTASAYTVRVKNTVATGTLGQLRISASGLWFQFTYDTAAAIASTDNLFVGGFNDAGMTAKNCVMTGTSNLFGSEPGALATVNNVVQTMGAAITIGAGGTFSFDNTASTTLQLKGSIWVGTGGVLDLRGSATKTNINTLIMDMTIADQGIFTGQTQFGGQILTTGAPYTIYAKYASGVGIAADPLTYQSAHGLSVGDEIVIPGLTYSTNQVRYVITVVNTTQVVVSSTSGGAEAAITNTPAVGSHISNLTRNVIIKSLTTTKGFMILNNSSTATCDFSYTRMEYSDCASGKGLTLNGTAGGTNTSTFDGLVLYHNSISGRGALLLGTTTNIQTHTGVILYNTQGGNFSAQSGIQFGAANNKTLVDCFHYNAPGSTVSCAFISLGSSSTGNTFNNCHSYGGNSANAAGGYTVGIFASSANTFNNCTINSTRQNAVYFTTAIGNVFNNCNFGTIGTNTNDIISNTGTLNQNLFVDCSFGSATLHSNYLTQLDTSIAKFQNMDGNTNKHRWITNYGQWWSAGSGLTDTTVRTAGSLSLVSKPENNTTGSSWTFKIPAAPTSSVAISGYVYRNATFSSGTLKVELFLPGTLLTDTPDDTYTFPTTTGSWLDFNINAYYSGSVARYAIVRITGVTATAGAYFFVDDLYDAGTNNKVAGLDLWDEGKPSEIMVVTDFSSAVPVLAEASRQAILGDTDTWPSNSKGKIIDDTKLTNVLVADL